jgi:hypothetical protein
MKTTLIVAALLAFPPVAWSAGKKGETHLTMDQLPAAVKATIEKESAGAKVEEIEKETEGGKTFYEAEIVKDGRESYIHVSQRGKVLKRETAKQERKVEGAEKEEPGARQR